METETTIRIINFAILMSATIFLIISALISLGRRSLPDKIKLIWAVAIILLPILGSIVFWIVNPQKGSTQGT